VSGRNKAANARLAVVTDIMAPYRMPLLNAVAEKLGDRFAVFFMGDQTQNRLWHSLTEQAAFRYLILPGRDIASHPGLGFNQFWNPGMFRALRDFDPQVIVVGGYHHPTSYVVLAYARLKRRKLILWFESTGFDTRPRSRLRAIIKQWFMSQCSGFLVPGIASEEYLLSLGIPAERIYRSPNSIDVNLFEATADIYRTEDHRRAFRQQHGLPEHVIMFVGRFSPEKGFPLLVEIVERLQKSGQNVGLLIIGDGPRREEYKKLVERLTPGSALLLGFVQPSDLPFFYAQADLLLVPSVSEPWGFVVQEALACRLPVVCSRHVGSAYDLIKNGETGFVCNNIHEYLESITLLLADPAARAQIGLNGSRRAREFSPQAAADGFLGIAARFGA
jgi:glycosyltransferase involved in cell wall biosynthesis